MAKRDLLVSFHHSDREQAEWIVAQLRGAGYQVFFAPELPPGTNFLESLSTQIEAGAVMIALMSPASLEAPWPRIERDVAFHRFVETGEVTLIPVVVRPCDLTGFLRPLHRIDLLDLDRPAARRELLRGVSVALGTRSQQHEKVEAGVRSRKRSLRAKGNWFSMAAAALVVLNLGLGLEWLRLTQKVVVPIEPSLKVAVRTLGPIESSPRGSLEDPVSIGPDAAYVALIFIPLGPLSASSYCVRFSTPARKSVEEVCGLEVDPQGHLQLGLPPNYFAPGLYKAALYEEGRGPDVTLATYALRFEDTP